MTGTLMKWQEHSWDSERKLAQVPIGDCSPGCQEKPVPPSLPWTKKIHWSWYQRNTDGLVLFQDSTMVGQEGGHAKHPLKEDRWFLKHISPLPSCPAGNISSLFQNSSSRARSFFQCPPTWYSSRTRAYGSEKWLDSCCSYLTCDVYFQGVTGIRPHIGTIFVAVTSKYSCVIDCHRTCVEKSLELFGRVYILWVLEPGELLIFLGQNKTIVSLPWGTLEGHDLSWSNHKACQGW